MFPVPTFTTMIGTVMKVDSEIGWMTELSIFRDITRHTTTNYGILIWFLGVTTYVSY